MPNASFFLKYRLHHLFIWMLVFAIWYFFRVDDYAHASTAFRITLIKVADLAIMIYLVTELLIPRLLYKKKYFLFTLAFISLILLSSVTKMVVIGKMTNNPALYHWGHDWKRRVYDNILPHFFLVVAGAAIKLMMDYGRLQKRMGEIAKEKAEAELNFLKSQINPHFVFNSLNAIYFLIHKENTDARNALHRFSDMLRYQLYEMSGQKLAIEKEIAYLRDYMDLQQLRKDDRYQVSFNCTAAVKGFSIEPLLLVPLVENAFKHISHHPDQSNKVEVRMDLPNGQFLFAVKNTKELLRSTEKPGGIGLQNVKRRLELLYPDKHELLIQETDHEFHVTLKIKVS